jgi:hypothetical protein
VSKSPSQARVTSPNPIAVRTWFTTPDVERTHFQAIPAATSGVICGRKRTVRDAVPKRPVAIRRMTDATISPRPTGMKEKNTISLKALRMTPTRSGSVRTLM